MTKTIDRETLFELTEEDGAKKLNEHATKHDCHWETWVVPFEGKFWITGYEASYNNGVEGEAFELEEAEEYEVTVKKWRKVK